MEEETPQPEPKRHFEFVVPDDCHITGFGTGLQDVQKCDDRLEQQWEKDVTRPRF